MRPPGLKQPPPPPKQISPLPGGPAMDGDAHRLRERRRMRALKSDAPCGGNWLPSKPGRQNRAAAPRARLLKGFFLKKIPFQIPPSCTKARWKSNSFLFSPPHKEGGPGEPRRAAVREVPPGRAFFGSSGSFQSHLLSPPTHVRRRPPRSASPALYARSRTRKCARLPPSYFLFSRGSGRARAF